MSFRRPCNFSSASLQAEHERTQSRLFELESRQDGATAVAHSDAELAAEDVERTQRLVGCAPHPASSRTHHVAASIHGWRR